jgi:hypothetical protein
MAKYKIKKITDLSGGMVALSKVETESADDQSISNTTIKTFETKQ